MNPDQIDWHGPTVQWITAVKKLKDTPKDKAYAQGFADGVLACSPVLNDSGSIDRVINVENKKCVDFGCWVFEKLVSSLLKRTRKGSTERGWWKIAFENAAKNMDYQPPPPDPKKLKLN